MTDIDFPVKFYKQIVYESKYENPDIFEQTSGELRAKKKYFCSKNKTIFKLENSVLIMYLHKYIKNKIYFTFKKYTNVRMCKSPFLRKY